MKKGVTEMVFIMDRSGSMSGLDLQFSISDPGIAAGAGTEYIASYRLSE